MIKAILPIFAFGCDVNNPIWLFKKEVDYTYVTLPTGIDESSPVLAILAVEVNRAFGKLQQPLHNRGMTS